MCAESLLTSLRGLAHLYSDSREVGAGDVFVALKGTTFDGCDFIESVLLDQGAAGVVHYGDLDTFFVGDLTARYRERYGRDPFFVSCGDAGNELVKILRAFYDTPDYINAVTGTNGKTSVGFFGAQMLSILRGRSASIGTLGVLLFDAGGHSRLSGFESSLTTPDIVSLYRVLGFLKKWGVEYVFIEASSIGIHQGRLGGLCYRSVIFTNFSLDHLDYHGSLQEYFSQKLRLFSELSGSDTDVILNADDKKSSEIACAARGDLCFLYGSDEGVGAFKSPDGVDRLSRVCGEFVVRCTGEGLGGTDFIINSQEFAMGVLGDYQVYNFTAAAISVLRICGSECALSDIAKIAPLLSGISGRMERVKFKGGAFFVDFAHTPDALTSALRVLRNLSDGAGGVCPARVVCVFGCGGDRDRVKRFEMGRIAAQNSDVVIVTDDNPRSEDAGCIRGEILRGARSAVPSSSVLRSIASRRRAIEYAFENFREGDLVLVAGKGHERIQVLRDGVLEFSDMDCIVELVEASGT